LRLHRTNWTWSPLACPRQTAALEAVQQKWLGTPYGAGQQVPGVAVDCVRLLCRMLDELHGLDETPLAQIPPDASMHTREGAQLTMMAIMHAYKPWIKITDGKIEPGDIVVVGPVGGGPGHGMMVSTRRNCLIHADQEEVALAGLGFFSEHQRVFGVFRKGNREEWARV
jgi:hypothetical protein